MKKILTLMVVGLLVTGFAGCTRQDEVVDRGPDDRQMIIDDAIVQRDVRTWGIYTNPQFRYELRHPKTWEIYQTTEGGEDVVFYPRNRILSDDYLGAFHVNGYVNWRTEYTLEEYYQNQQRDLFFEQEPQEFEFHGMRAVWFKDVKGLVGADDSLVDVVALDGNDRIIEFIFIDEFEQSQVMFNSLQFYGTKVIDNLEGATAPLPVQVEIEGDGQVDINVKPAE